jgi:hypothetical protein
LTSSDRNQSTKRHPAPPNSSTGSSQVKTREISIPPLTNTPSHKGQTQSQGNGPDPSKYAVDQKAPVPIPRNLRIMPNDTIRRPRIPSKSTMSNSRAAALGRGPFAAGRPGYRAAPGGLSNPL